MSRRALSALAAAAALAGLASPAAQADFLPADVADGPSPDILSLGGAELTADGTGGLAYLKREGGVAHVFASRLERGRPLPPVRVDAGQAGEASDLRFSSGEQYGAMALWRSGGALWAARRAPGEASAWEPPKLVYDGTAPATDPQLDTTLLGTGYVSFTVAGDVRVARMTWQESEWTLLSRPMDADPALPAGDADIAAAADGSALAAWVETGLDGVSHVFARRVNEDGALSEQVREVSVRSLSGRPGGSADSPSVDTQDDSSYGFIVLRQDFADGGATVSRAFGRRLVTSSLEPPRAIDGLDFPTADAAGAPVVEVSGKGRGMNVTPLRSGAAIGAPLMRREPLYASWRKPERLDVASPPPPPAMTGTMSEGEQGLAAWQQNGPGLPTVRARHWENGKGFFPEVTLSDPALGPTEPALGFFSGSDARIDSIVAWVQGGDGNRRIMVSAYAGPLRPAAIPNRPYWTRQTRPTLRWNPLTNVLWGPVTYSIEIDGKRYALTRRTKWRSRRRLPDGAHVVRITQLDGRGTESPGLDRPLWIDTTKPTVRYRKGRLFVEDGSPLEGSGIASVRVVFGRRSVSLRVPNIGRVQGARIGRRPLRVIAKDKAGNTAVVSGKAAAR